jgi:hypothetical protein
LVSQGPANADITNFCINCDVILANVLALKPSKHPSKNMIGAIYIDEQLDVDTLPTPNHRFGCVLHGFIMICYIALTFFENVFGRKTCSQNDLKT